MESFEAMPRKVGTSIGILIPKDVASGLKFGEPVRVVIFKPNLKILKKGFGMAKRAGSFEREKEDREF